MTRMLLLATGLGTVLLLLGCVGGRMSTKEIRTVEHLDIQRYLGTWYEIARFPHRFERGLVNVTATYSVRDDGKLEVLNQGYVDTKDGKKSVARGVAWVPDPAEPARLKVSFFWIFAGDYKVFALDQDNYEYAMVTSSSKRFLWILARKPALDDSIYQQLLQKAESYGFDLSQLIKVPQDWE